MNNRYQQSLSAAILLASLLTVASSSFADNVQTTNQTAFESAQAFFDAGTKPAGNVITESTMLNGRCVDRDNTESPARAVFYVAGGDEVVGYEMYFQFYKPGGGTTQDYINLIVQAINRHEMSMVDFKTEPTFALEKHMGFLYQFRTQTSQSSNNYSVMKVVCSDPNKRCTWNSHNYQAGETASVCYFKM